MSEKLSIEQTIGENIFQAGSGGNLDITKEQYDIIKKIFGKDPVFGKIVNDLKKFMEQTGFRISGGETGTIGEIKAPLLEGKKGKLQETVPGSVFSG